jgi:Fur family iron response transcriptional regulator
MILITEKDRTTACIQGLLLEHDIRPTAQRIEIAAVLLSQPQHLSADQVMSRVNRDGTVVSKATVYNTLNLFAEKGLIREVIIESGKVFYDSNTDIHHHIYNEDTGTLLDVAATEMTIENIPELPEGTVQSGVDVIIRVRNKA